MKDRFQLGPSLHMTNLDNLADILKEKGFHSFNQMAARSYSKLSNDEVQSGRATKTVSVSGKLLHDYVPLYFGWKTPMVAYNQDKNEEILFFRFSLEILQIEGVVFSDGNGRSNDTKFFSFNNIDDLKVLDARTINSVKWNDILDPDKKRRKQAEILVPDFLPLTQLLEIIVFSESSELKALALQTQFGTTIPVRVNTGFYFKDSISGAQKP